MKNYWRLCLLSLLPLLMGGGSADDPLNRLKSFPNSIASPKAQS
jgi:hypothetical protein